MSEHKELKGIIKNYTFKSGVSAPGDLRYAAPESLYRYICISGNVFNYSGTKFNDNQLITTSEVINIKNNDDGTCFVLTISGSKYKLINPCENYKKWCTENNKSIIPEMLNN